MKILTPFEAAKKLSKNNNNLNFLLKKRFIWMKNFINGKKNIIELGSGNGVIKKFLGKNIITSDIVHHKGIDFIIDMNTLNIPKKLEYKVDVFILNHCLHHSYNPYELLNKMKKNLKPGGLVLINEPEISLIFKFFLKILNHEKWDLNLKNSKKKDFWYQNNATGKILFSKNKEHKFIKKNFSIIKNELNEFIIFLNSSGNSVNTPHIKLSKILLKFFDKLDDILIKFFPNIFALNRRVVLKVKKNEK